MAFFGKNTNRKYIKREDSCTIHFSTCKKLEAFIEKS